MKTRKLLRWLVIGSLLTCGCLAQGKVSTPTAGAPSAVGEGKSAGSDKPEEKGQEKKAEKQEEKKAGKSPIEMGFQVRTRFEAYNNADMASLYTDTRDQLRFRFRAWIAVPLPADFKVTFGLVDEFRKVFSPDLPMSIDETLVETLFVERKNLWPHFSIKVGRQDIQRGEGFIFMDGTPGDGSRTFFSNAAIGAYAWGKSSLELMGVCNPARNRLFFVFNNKHRGYSEMDQDAFCAYFTNADIPKTKVEAYYLYKHMTNSSIKPTSFLYLPDRSINTLGARVTRDLGKGFTAVTEWAGQIGSTLADTSIRAWGGYGHLTKAFSAPGKPYLKAGWYGMSGDDPTTPDYEGWDPPFSRWPKWGEFLGYAMTVEKGVAYYTNMHMAQAEFGIAPKKYLSLKATVYRIFAFHPFGRNPLYLGDGLVRGTYATARADFTITKELTGHVLYELFEPGSYYKSGDRGHFFRAEIIYTFKHNVKR